MLAKVTANSSGKKIMTVVLVIIAALIIGGVALYIVRFPAKRAATSRTAIIRVEPTDFLPEVLTVQKGTTVTWANGTDNGVRITSTPFPQHSDLPDLDSTQNIGRGDNYSYTFNTAGEYGYINYTNPTVQGKVVVK